MTALAFERVERPKVVTSRGEPNPYADIVAELAANQAQTEEPLALGFTLDKAAVGAVTEKGNYPGVEKARRQLREAGTACTPPVTIRSHVEGPDKSGTVKISFWATAKRTRKPSGGGDAGAGQGAVEGSAS